MDERTYFTCIVASRSHTLYIGITGDLRMRVYQHKESCTQTDSPHDTTATGSSGSSDSCVLENAIKRESS